ncbi:aminoacetone oxidase family FAD-binding enzyme [Sulfurimonas sp. SAG-AH-194-C21]|nr:aminoacetone oxidase family FAD-binding enzyme [Sulfurimonas sp. SAG-AH-194-C21]MDF1882836.1 aminoacetone oxidase family FAD-binding enzyme [Sulfurimonas sp. SAG-AH-194-C21]
MKIYDVIILGAGASGLMCAGNIGKKKSVLIIEGNDKVAKKLKISGGGKCNITNVSVELNNFDGEEHLIKEVLQRFSKDNLLEFLDRNRVDIELRKNRYYFCERSADDIIYVLKNAAKHAEIQLGEKILSVTKENEGFKIKTDKNDYSAKKVVIATGGISFINLGASGIGLEIAKSFELEVKEFTPALVGLTVQKEQFWMRELSGLSCFVNITVGDRIAKEEMLFAHKGISGPAVLTASLYWKKGLMSINFLPDKDITQLVMGSKKLVSSVINLPKRLSKALLKAVNIEDKECKKLTQEDIQNLSRLHAYSFAPAGNFGFTKAEVSRGGVLAKELDFKTCESKTIQGLYFIGEVVDITGELGGYNFQWAFSSAYVCAKAIK